ncbi:murein hydrolase activator EnvC, partial [Cellulomonas sp. B6]|uniref:murein hydrolase activator EnvC family protein n=1 Tax=Cellulomonas sp. B6 TaxID=1295626 RepID=UPI000AB506D0
GMPAADAPAARRPRHVRGAAAAVVLTCAAYLALAVATSADGTPHAPAPPVVYRPPLAPPVTVVREFDAPPRPWLAGHRGVDLAAVEGDRVLAPARGVVTFAGRVVDRGVVTVEHPDGRRSSLEPVAASVAAGHVVEVGDEIGEVTGRAHAGPDGTGADAVHWGVREGDVYLDPWALLPGLGPVVLLPVD